MPRGHLCPGSRDPLVHPLPGRHDIDNCLEVLHACQHLAPGSRYGRQCFSALNALRWCSKTVVFLSDSPLPNYLGCGPRMPVDSKCFVGIYRLVMRCCLFPSLRLWRGTASCNGTDRALGAATLTKQTLFYSSYGILSLGENIL